MARTMRRGRKSRGKRAIGYAVIGLGHLAQTAVLPAFANARNSRLAALVSGDPVKRARLAAKYHARACGYDQLEDCLASEDVDAVYICGPNALHAELAVRAARAGAHVLCEKPMAVSEPQCQQMIDACRDSDVKLMVAYRLHFEEGNLRAIELARSGKLGELRLFDSAFCYQVRPGNIRLRREAGGGPTWDIGIYGINAARNLFADEPIEVAAFALNGQDARFAEVEEGVGALLRFRDDRMACFTCSFDAAPEARFELLGTSGRLSLANAFEYHGERRLSWTAGGRMRTRTIPESDQFGPELAYFSDCILTGADPEPSGNEGLADVRIIEALFRSAAERRSLALEPVVRRQRPGIAQLKRRPAVGKVPGIGVERPLAD